MPPIVTPVKKVFLQNLNKYAFFNDRQAMKVGHPTIEMHMPPALPQPILPIDWAKNFSFPNNGNDIYGDCMMAAAEHADNTFTANNGAESVYNVNLTVKDYLALSGGDNGLNSGTIINAWTTGLPGIADARIMEAMSVDTTNAALVQAAIWLFGGVFFTLNIPDGWYKNFNGGETWDAPASPDDNNGHGVWWNGVSKDGHYHLETWGTDAWITPAGVPDCDPAGFAVFSMRWFNSKGVAPNGLNYLQLADYWKKMGGSQLPAWPAEPLRSDRLRDGQGLLPGSFIKSQDGRFTLIMQLDGNLVIYGPGHQALWASNTAGHHDVFDVVMQSDGNLVLYNGTNHPFWASNTAGVTGASLVMQNDGNLVIYDAANKAHWASNTVVPATPAAPARPDRLLPGQGLLPGQHIKSLDGRFTLILQTDGNLVAYGPRNNPIWASNTNGHGNVWSAIMQGDGNFVVYDAHAKALWATGTNGKGGQSLIMQSDGNVVLYNPENHALWASDSVAASEPATPTQHDRLLPGQGLLPNSSIKSADGRFTLTLQNDGNLVLYGPAHQAMWASNTNGHSSVWSAIMQSDGNLVVYDAHAKALWASGTNGKLDSTLVVQNDGNLVIYDAANHAIWASNTQVPASHPAPTVKDRITSGQALIVGASITSNNGQFHLILQADGNLVAYDKYNVAIWSSKTNGHSGAWELVMQSDGNLVMYDVKSHAFWATNTNGKGGVVLIMQDDGNVVLYNAANHPLWASNTAGAK